MFLRVQTLPSQHIDPNGLPVLVPQTCHKKGVEETHEDKGLRCLNE